LALKIVKQPYVTLVTSPSPAKLFAPPGKICWALLKTIGHSLKKRKLFATPGVPSWLRACLMFRQLGNQNTLPVGVVYQLKFVGIYWCYCNALHNEIQRGAGMRQHIWNYYIQVPWRNVHLKKSLSRFCLLLWDGIVFNPI